MRRRGLAYCIGCLAFARTSEERAAVCSATPIRLVGRCWAQLRTRGLVRTSEQLQDTGRRLEGTAPDPELAQTVDAIAETVLEKSRRAPALTVTFSGSMYRKHFFGY